MLKIAIDPVLCKKEGICAEICHRFSQRDKDSVPAVVDEESCNSCGHCVAICPQGAISHVDFPQGSIRPVKQEAIPSFEQVDELIRARRSRREFRDRPVEREVIGKVIDGARFAPSAKNAQSTEFIVIQDKAALSKITELTVDYLAKIARQLRNPVIRMLLLTIGPREVKSAIQRVGDFDRVVSDVRNGKDRILMNAPALILFHADRGAIFAGVNANLSLQNATFVSEALGLGSFYTGYVVAACDRDSRIPGFLRLPKEHKIYGGLALGYPKYGYKNWIERRPPRIRWI
jgi:nitroreductase/NAD-dependent dihydropyrimidine dehydrogenase PreA subunit